MEICNKDSCTGCMACADKCKKGAITFIKSYDGFLYPYVDSEKCNNCGLCKKVCPANLNLNKQTCESSDFSPEVYLLQANDSERQKSSSGAFCATLARSFIENHGFVAGCVCNNTSIEHIVSDDLSDIERMRGSKYVQSNMSGNYLKIQNLLKHGKKVLFTGLPCQVAALKSFLGKHYDNLVTVDLICHGVCSEDLLQTILRRELKLKANLSEGQLSLTKIINVVFRDKSITNFDFTISYIIGDNNQETSIRISVEQSLFYKIYDNNIALRRSCGCCKFSCAWPRQGDFSAGDFRGVKGFTKYLDQKGSSIVFVNTLQTVNVLHSIKSQFNKCLSVPFMKAQSSQYNLVSSTAHHPSREMFFNNYYNQPDKVDLSSDEFIGKNVAILNFSFEESNFGAVLTCAGLYHAVQELGYNPRVIDYSPYFAIDCNTNLKFQQFKDSELEFTEHYNCDDSLSTLNDKYAAFIVGSDQVLNHCLVKVDRSAYYLTFAKLNKKTICYAGSFGLNAEDYLKLLSQSDKKSYGNSLNMFDAVSLREASSGREICNALNCENVVGVLDPVFICSAEYWNKLADKVPQSVANNEVVEYALSPSSVICNIALPSGYNAITRFFCDGNNASPYDWLNSIKHCNLFITDSFHGTCFSLIFNRPFIVCSEKESTLVRINELLELIDPKLKERVVLGEIDDINQTLSSLQTIDWHAINQRIEELRADSLLFLKNNLERTITPQDLERKTIFKQELRKDRMPEIKRKLFFYRIKRLLYRLLAVANKKKYQNKIDKYQTLIHMLKLEASYLNY